MDNWLSVAGVGIARPRVEYDVILRAELKLRNGRVEQAEVRYMKTRSERW